MAVSLVRFHVTLYFLFVVLLLSRSLFSCDVITFFVFTGFALVDVSTPYPMRGTPRWVDLPPVYARRPVTRHTVGRVTRRLAERTHRLTRPSTALSGAYEGTDLLLSCRAINWLRKHSIRVTNIKCVYEFTPAAYLKPVLERLSTLREYARHYEMPAIATCAKLTSNAFYGKTLCANARWSLHLCSAHYRFHNTECFPVDANANVGRQHIT